MKKNLFFLLTFPILLFSQNVDDYVQKQIELLDIPSLSVSIIENNNQTLLKTYNNSTSSETTKSTYVIGSLTKSFTALAIMQLIENKKLELNASVKNYLPWFEVRNRDYTELITIKSLLNQTSGFSTYEGLKNFSKNTKLEDDIKALKKTSLISKPNERFMYSNINYQILGLIIEKVSGLSYSKYLEKNIFKPLEMNNTFTSKDEAKNLAKGHRTWFGINIQENFQSNKSLLAAGYIISNIEDMSKYIKMILDKGRFKNKVLLKEENFSMILKKAFPIVKDKFYYGFGWFINNDKYGLKLNHKGAAENYMSTIIIDPIKKDAILVLQNKMTYTINASRINDLPLNIMLTKKNIKPKKSVFDLKEIIAYIFLPLILCLQVFFIFSFIKKRKDKDIKKKSIMKRFLIPIFFDMIIVTFLLMLPSFFNLNLSAFTLFNPDLGYMIYAVILVVFIKVILRIKEIIKDTD